MTENNNPVAEEPNESSAADTFFKEDAAPAEKTSRNFWSKPAAIVAGAAIASGLLGFAIGNVTSNEMRPASISGEAFNGGRGGDADGDHGNFGGPGQQGGKHRGPGMMDRQGAPGQPGQGPAPHCHDVSGTDVASNPDGTCVDGSAPGLMPNNAPIPAPSASSTTSVQ